MDDNRNLNQDWKNENQGEQTKKSRKFALKWSKDRNRKEEIKGGKKKHKTKAIIAVVLVIVVAAGTVFTFRSKGKKAQASGNRVMESKVQKGNLSQTVEGTGTLANADSTDLKIPVGLKIKKVKVSEGDEVKKGDTLATVDKTSLLAALAETQQDLDDVNKQLGEEADSDTSKYIESSVDGRVKKIYASKNTDAADTVLEKGALMLISLDGKMAVKMDTSVSLTVGQEVKVVLSSGSSVTGTVTKAEDEACTITVTDKGTKYNDKVTAYTASETKIGTGKLYINKEAKVTATSGTVSSILVSENESVSEGDDLIKLKGDFQSEEYLSLESEKEDLEEKLASLLKIAKNNTITADSSGIITAVNISEDTESGSASENSSSNSSISSSSSGNIATATGTSGVKTTSTATASEMSGVKTTSTATASEISAVKTTSTATGTRIPAVKTANTATATGVSAVKTSNMIKAVSLSTASDTAPQNISDTTTKEKSEAETTESASKSETTENTSSSDSQTSGSQTGNNTTNSGQNGSTGNSGSSTTDSSQTGNSTSNSSQSSNSNTSNSSSNNTTSGSGNTTTKTTTENKTSGENSGGTGNNSETNSQNSTTSGNASGASGAMNGSKNGTGGMSGFSGSAAAGSAGAIAGSSSGSNALSGTTSGSTSTTTSSTSTDTNTELTSAFSIASGDEMTLSVSVDEMDILSVKTGQKATITFDAIENKEYEGEITSIDKNGTTSNGTTKYPVEITATKEDSMMAGMNASVTITTSEVSDALLIPAVAVTEEGNTSYVYTQKDSKSGELSGKTEVQTGDTDGTNIVITSGLSEGDTVYYSMSAGGSSNENSDSADNQDKQNMKMNGNFGGGRGGNDGGTPPSGGNPGGNK